MEPAPERIIRITSEEGEADEWHLALLADEIPHRLDATTAGWALVVRDGDAAWAMEMLDDYDSERKERAAAVLAPPLPDAPSWLGAVAALLLFSFHLTLVSHGLAPAWLAAGAASSERILHGEPFRALTALTLHADYVHVLGNAVAAVILFTALGRWIGSGVAAFLVLVGGTLGNLANALLHGTAHTSIGASTATFAAVGLLAGFQLLRRRRLGDRRMRALIPLGGALALFAMMGTGGPNTDVLAHLCGLGAGLLLGVPAAMVVRARPPATVQIPLGIATLAAIAGAWALALR